MKKILLFIAVTVAYSASVLAQASKDPKAYQMLNTNMNATSHEKPNWRRL